ncbi:hypothetical protein ACLBKW_00980 [Bacillus altitudinis]|uniref:hypothetical protein n=1 Tax=Bacillus altitudinis TaxID=293387 RepID=UPI0039E0BACF
MNLNILASYIVENYGDISGKKAFQKIFYFLTEAEVPTGLNYTLYHYGPYSSQLDYGSAQMELAGAISVIPKGRGYEITLGAKSKEFSQEESLNEFKEVIDQVLSKLPLKNPLMLELYSTTHYAAKVLKDVYDNYEKNDVVDEVKRIKKDKFSVKQIEEAYEFLTKENLM